MIFLTYTFPLILLLPFHTFAQSPWISAPSNLTATFIENRTPDCPFNATFTTLSNSTNSTLQISYKPSPFDTIRKRWKDSNNTIPKTLTCRLVLELAFDMENYTAAAQEAMFRVYVNTNYGEDASIEMKTVWTGNKAMDTFEPKISIPGPLTSFEEFMSNRTSFQSTCGYGWGGKSTEVNVLTTFTLSEGRKPWDPLPGKRDVDLEGKAEKFWPVNQTVMFGWEACHKDG